MAISSHRNYKIPFEIDNRNGSIVLEGLTTHGIIRISQNKGKCEGDLRIQILEENPLYILYVVRKSP